MAMDPSESDRVFAESESVSLDGAHRVSKYQGLFTHERLTRPRLQLRVFRMCVAQVCFV